MSFKLMAQALEVKTGSCITKMVLLKLCDNASDEGECWPSHGTIAKHCEVGKSTVRKHINKLIEMGYVKKVERTDKNGRQKSNVYMIDLGCHDMAGGCHEVAGEVPRGSTLEPIREPTKEEKYTKEFEEFWDIYPKKVAKVAAFKSYKAALKKDEAYVIISGLIGHPCLKAEHQFMPYPATWLNQERWKDEKPNQVEPKEFAAMSKSDRLTETHRILGL